MPKTIHFPTCGDPHTSNAQPIISLYKKCFVTVSNVCCVRQTQNPPHHHQACRPEWFIIAFGLYGNLISHAAPIPAKETLSLLWIYTYRMYICVANIHRRTRQIKPSPPFGVALITRLAGRVCVDMCEVASHDMSTATRTTEKVTIINLTEKFDSIWLDRIGTQNHPARRLLSKKSHPNNLKKSKKKQLQNFKPSKYECAHQKSDQSLTQWCEFKVLMVSVSGQPTSHMVLCLFFYIWLDANNKKKPLLPKLIYVNDYNWLLM